MVRGLQRPLPLDGKCGIFFIPGFASIFFYTWVCKFFFYPTNLKIVLVLLYPYRIANQKGYYNSEISAKPLECTVQHNY